MRRHKMIGFQLHIGFYLVFKSSQYYLLPTLVQQGGIDLS